MNNCNFINIKDPLTDTEFYQQNLLRVNGLDSINKIESNYLVCGEVFKQPLFYMTGFTKMCFLSGCTGQTIGPVTTPEWVYNLSEIDDLNITCFFTGNTDNFTAYTSSTFTYVLKNNLGNNVISNNFIFSSITSNTISTNILSGLLPSEDLEYLLKPTFNWKPKTCNITDTDISINLIENSYNENLDWFMVTVTNPPKPLLQPMETLGGGTLNLVNERIDLNTYPIPSVVSSEFISTNQFFLSKTPVGETVILSINGSVISNGEFFVNRNGTTYYIKLVNEFSKNTDIITATYLTSDNPNNNLVEGLINDSFTVTGITSGTGSTYNNSVNYNTTTSRYEIFLSEDVRPNSNVFLSINGSLLTQNLDFTASNTVLNRLIMSQDSQIISPNDIINVFYFKDNNQYSMNLGNLTTQTPTLSWYLPELLPVGRLGEFILEVTDVNDINFSGLTYTGLTNYTGGTGVYSQQISTPLTVGEEYIYRVYFKKYMINTSMSNTYITDEYSDIGYFKISDLTYNNY